MKKCFEKPPDQEHGKRQAEADMMNISELIEALEAAGSDRDREEVEERIHEYPLEVSIREGWKAPGGEPYSGVDYKILLSTGGPASRIIGELDQWNQPESARLEHQDWFTLWERLQISGEDEQVLVKFAQCFYFGE